ncbi:MAG: penicillin-binding transpeptidase domain-containing protein [bacterium]|nr:penicillin-binding transpeptidase domain-containing protein [bacterium]
MRYKKNKRGIEVEEIFLDAKNMPGYHKENLEGRVENPIKSKIFAHLGSVFLVLFFVFLGRAVYLQAITGDALRDRSEKNYLKVSAIVPERGIVYDRNGKPLLENSTSTTKYLTEGFLHLVGYANNEGGSNGLEANYDDILKGVLGQSIEEVDAKGNIISSGIGESAESGKNLLTSIDKDLQIKLTQIIKSVADERGFVGGVGIVIDVRTGEVLAMASVPEFDPNLLSSGNKVSQETITSLINDPKKPFINRAVSGLYPPGSIVKPAVALGALKEGIIDPSKQILSTGSISIPNSYFPDKPSVFPDWKAHGWVDMRQALAYSSDVYFYEVGGGFQDQKGLGAFNLKKYFSLFGFGEPTGIDLEGEKSGFVPDPSNHKNTRAWTIGDTYHMAIGQGEMLVTPMQIAVYVTSIATDGIMPYPHIVQAIVDNNKKVVEKLSYAPKKTDMLPVDLFKIVKEGMRGSATYGTASGLSGLQIPIGAKTGTAEIGDTGRVHSWSIGFFPYEEPLLAYTILMESGSSKNLVGATYAAAQMIGWMAGNNFLSGLDNDIMLSTR